MNTPFRSRSLQITGSLILLLGIIHEVYFFIAPQELTSGVSSADTQTTLIYMFLATGLAVIFAGLLTIHSANKLAQQPLALELVTGATTFIFVLGAGAVMLMSDNPFAYLMLVIAVLQMGALFFSWRGRETVHA